MQLRVSHVWLWLPHMFELFRITVGARAMSGHLSSNIPEGKDDQSEAYSE